MTNPDQDDLPWSSKALDQCLRRGAEIIGWDDRDPAPRSMREGDQLIGYGMAAVSFFYFQQPCTVRVVVRRDGTAAVHCAAMDIGTGTYTVVTQVAAERLGLDLADVEVVLGDSSLPASPPAGGSGTGDGDLQRGGPGRHGSPRRPRPLRPAGPLGPVRRGR